MQYSYLNYSLGSLHCNALIEAPHAFGKGNEFATKDIAQTVAARTGAAYLVANVSRCEMDMGRLYGHNGNEPAILEKYRCINEVVAHRAPNGLVHPFFHLAVHGMRDESSPYAIELGDVNGKSANPAMIDTLYTIFSSRGFSVAVNQKFDGDRSLQAHRIGDQPGLTGYNGFGSDYHAVQIEFNANLRTNFLPVIFEGLSFFIADTRLSLS